MCRIIIELSSPIELDKDDRLKNILNDAIAEYASEVAWEDGLFMGDDFFAVRRIVATVDA